MLGASRVLETAALWPFPNRETEALMDGLGILPKIKRLVENGYGLGRDQSNDKVQIWI